MLRSYLETYKDLTLDRLKRILRSHYGVKNTPELYPTLASLGRSQKESPQAFLMKALDLRQQIILASSDESDDTYLQYDSEHIQRLFLRSVETSLQDESIRAKIHPFLKDLNVADDVLMQQMGVAVSAEKERDKKLGRNKPSSPLVTVALVSDPSNEKKSKPSCCTSVVLSLHRISITAQSRGITVVKEVAPNLEKSMNEPFAL